MQIFHSRQSRMDAVNSAHARRKLNPRSPVAAVRECPGTPLSYSADPAPGREAYRRASIVHRLAALRLGELVMNSGLGS